MRAAQIERKPGAGRERQDRCERVTDDAEKSPSAGGFRCPNGCLGSRGSRFDSVMCRYEGFEAIRGAPPSRWPRSLTRIRGKPRAAEVANQFAGLGLATAYRAFDHTCRLPWRLFVSGHDGRLPHATLRESSSVVFAKRLGVRLSFSASRTALHGSSVPPRVLLYRRHTLIISTGCSRNQPSFSDGQGLAIKYARRQGKAWPTSRGSGSDNGTTLRASQRFVRHRHSRAREKPSEAELKRSCRSGDRSALQPETYSHLHLKFGFRISHGTPNLPDLEPIDVAQRLARLGDGVT